MFLPWVANVERSAQIRSMRYMQLDPATWSACERDFVGAGRPVPNTAGWRHRESRTCVGYRGGGCVPSRGLFPLVRTDGGLQVTETK